MAIFSLNIRLIKRSSNRNVVKEAAYCSGTILADEKTKKEFSYLSKKGVVYSEIITPPNYPHWCDMRAKLWNAVERAEKRKDAQLARETIVALPRELNLEQQKNLLLRFVKENFVSKGMIADVNIHHDNENNPHAHILLTMRRVENGVFTKKVREWNDREALKDLRKNWANLVNFYLEAIGSKERVSELSHFKRGLTIKPTIHLGFKNHQALKKGIILPRAKRNKDIIEERLRMRLIVNRMRFHGSSSKGNALDIVQEKKQANLDTKH
jgi:hypothetical protein